MAENKSNTNKNIFEKSPEETKPKFRELVEQRMNKIMEEENYKAIENKKIDATTSLDEKGRPKTYRNIINKRKEDYEEGTLDIDTIDTTEFDNYTSFVTNTLNSNTTMPASEKERQLEELKLKPKSALTYTERKMLNQGSALNQDNTTQANALDERRKQLDVELAGKRRSNNDGYIEGIEIPVHFNRELKITDQKSNEVVSVKYKNTVEGRHDFVIWLKLNGIYDRVERKLSPVTGDQALLKEKLDEESKINRVSIRATLQNDAGFKVERPQPVATKKPKQPKKMQMGGSEVLPQKQAVKKEKTMTKKIPPIIKQEPEQVVIKAAPVKKTQKPMIYMPSQQVEITPLKKLKQKQKVKTTDPIPQSGIKLSRPFKSTKKIVRRPLEVTPRKKVTPKTTKSEISNVVKTAATRIKYTTGNDDVAKLKKEIILLKQELLTNKVNRDVYNTVDFETDVNQGFVDADVMFGLEEMEIKPTTKNQLQINQNTPRPNTLSLNIDMSRIVKLKSKLRENDSTFPFSSMAFVVKAISNALEKFPIFNSKFDKSSQQVLTIKRHDIGIIIETDEKSVIPVISTANGLSIKELGTKLIGLTSDIRRGRKITEEHSTIKVGTFSGSASFMKPVLKNDNVAIIAISKIIKKPFEFNGKMYSKASMSLLLTYDERISKQDQADEFIHWIKYLLETPEILTLS